MTVSLEGYDQLVKQFEEISTVADEKEFLNKLIKRARKLRNAIRRKTPRSSKYSGSLNTKPGNLRNAIEARKFRRQIKGSPAVYVKINKRKAPHYHLVEFGTENFRYPKNKSFVLGYNARAIARGRSRRIKHNKVLHFIINGHDVFARWVGPMPAKPFFRPTVDMEKTNVIQGIKQDISDSIEKISNKK